MDDFRERGKDHQRVDAGIFQASLLAIGGAVADFCPPREDGTRPLVTLSRDVNHWKSVQDDSGQIVLPAVSVSLETMRRFTGGYNRMALQNRIRGETSDDGNQVARFKLSQVQADLRVNFSSDSYEEILAFASSWLAAETSFVVVLESMGVTFNIRAEMSGEVQIPPPSSDGPSQTTLTAGIIMTSYVGFYYMTPTVRSVSVGVSGAGRDAAGAPWTLKWMTVDKQFGETPT